MRATGITCEVIAKTEPLQIMQRDEHKNLSATQIYIGTAERFGALSNAEPVESPTAIVHESSDAPSQSHHPRAESRQLSVGSGASGSGPKGKRTFTRCLGCAGMAIGRLVTLHGHLIDFERMGAIVAQFAAALDEPDRAPLLEPLLDFQQ